MGTEPFLTMHPYHLSRAKARQAVLATLERGTSGRPKNVDWKNGAVNITSGKVTKRFMFSAMELEARQTGVLGGIQRLLDSSDGVFGGTMGQTATPNFQLTIKTEYAGWIGEVQGPCRIGLATDDLMEDILHYRKEACLASTDYTFRHLARHYRAYLSACISIVDAFINRHVLLASHDGFESEAFTRLKEARGMEEKIDCWLETCC